MKQTHSLLLVLAASSLILSASACDDSDVGVVRQNWTIDGRSDALVCSDVGAAQMRLVATDVVDVVQGTAFAPCTDFTASIQLPPGVYAVTATFLDDNGVAVALPSLTTGVSIDEDEETDLSVNFPLSSFIGRP